jgi:hypothetical protein
MRFSLFCGYWQPLFLMRLYFLFVRVDSSCGHRNQCSDVQWLQSRR